MTSSKFSTNLIHPKIKAICFDLNGTLTSSVSKHPYHLYFRNQYINDHASQSCSDDLPTTTTKALEQVGLDPEAYYHYRNARIDWTRFHKFSPATYSTLAHFAAQQYKLVLYTDCYLTQINPTLELLQLKHFFDLVLSREDGFKKPNPEAYKFIASKLDISLTELVMIANDWEQDLQPFHELGGNTIWIAMEDQLPLAKKNLDEFNSDQHKTSTTLTDINRKELQ